jgi:hypothetical protein
MTLIGSKREEPEHSRSREIPRNCGQLLGRLDALLPCLYIEQDGMLEYDLRERETDAATGLFAIDARTNEDYPPRVGLILPLRLCRDEKVRAALEGIPALIDNPQTTMSERRRAVQARLDEAFGDDLLIDDTESLDGSFALPPDPGLFHRLCEAFDYVTGVIDNPVDRVRVTGTARFHWRSHDELIEKFHGLFKSDWFGARVAFTPFFVSGNTEPFFSYRWAHAGLRRPIEEPSEWCVIHPDVPDTRLGIQLEMGTYGWARLHFTLGAVTVTIRLSEVFDPFGTLVAWGREIDEGDLPVEMEIDEEGTVAVLTALRTDDPARVLLRIRGYNKVLLGIMPRAALASSLKAELRRFFTTEFDTWHWDWFGGHKSFSTTERVLNHPWLASAK